MKLNLLRIVLLTCLVFLIGFHSLGQDHPGKFYTYEKDYDSNMDGYNVYVPNSLASSDQPYPVIVFLQGGLGVGGEVDKIFNWAFPKMLKETGSLDSELDKLVANTFVVVMPHIARGQFYNAEQSMRSVLNGVKEQFNIDKDRIYLTGLSRGGHGTWGLACRMPDVFAAIAPICGGDHGITEYEKLVDLPIWVTHNTGDQVVTYNNSENTVEALEDLTGKEFHKTGNIRSTNYKNKRWIFTSNTSNEHDAWTEMYNDVRFYKWLLQFSRGGG